MTSWHLNFWWDFFQKAIRVKENRTGMIRLDPSFFLNWPSNPCQLFAPFIHVYIEPLEHLIFKRGRREQWKVTQENGKWEGNEWMNAWEREGL